MATTGLRQSALKQTVASLENVSKLQGVFVRPTILESVNDWPIAVITIGQDERADYVQWVGGSEDDEVVGVIEIDLVTDQDDEELIFDLLDLFDDVADQIAGDFSIFRDLTVPVYLKTPLHLDEDPIIDIERELTAVRCRFTYHNGG